MDAKVTHSAAELRRLGLLAAGGEDARAFLHGQLTNDVEHLAPDRARHAGWCSAKGRLLATLLVVPHEGGYLLQLARDLAPAVAKRLSMFILRSKVKVADASDAWAQFGLWGQGAEAELTKLGISPPAGDLGVSRGGGWIAVRAGQDRFLLLGKSRLEPSAAEDEWWLEEIRSGRPTVTQATQDQFVPQMVNLELLGAVDFQKGCYPGQEIVARAQYRAQLKRRMYRVCAGEALRGGQELYSDDLPGQSSGIVVNASGNEALAVLQIASVESKSAIRTMPGGAALEVLPLPYQA